MQKHPCFFVLCFIMMLNQSAPAASSLEKLLEKIYQQTLSQEAHLDSLVNYSYFQKIFFRKYDGDGDIEEQSKRNYFVRVLSKENRDRQLTEAYDFDDGRWIDVSEQEKGNNPGQVSESREFSLGEMISPQARHQYIFRIINEQIIDGRQLIHLEVKAKQKDENRFSGNLWIDKTSFAMVRARLYPSENPTGIESMQMDFKLTQFGHVWLPTNISFQATISFLFFFKGQIRSDITFENYKFNQTFPD